MHAWQSVGTVIATEQFQPIGQITSNLLKLQYINVEVFSRYPCQGVLREEYETNFSNSRWYRLYPKVGEFELLYLRPIPEFISTQYETRTIEFKKLSSNSQWGLSVYQWIDIPI